MSNYTQSTYFTPKDTLPTSSPLKTIFGAAYDVEFGNISTAIASKLDASSGNTNLVLPAGSGSAPSLSFTGYPNTGLYQFAANAVGISANSTAVVSFSATSAAFVQPVTVIPATAGNTVSNALQVTNTTNNTASAVEISLTCGSSSSLIQTGSAYTGTPITNGLTGGIQTVLSAPGQVSLGCGNGAFMNVNATGNITMPAAASGATLTVNAVSGGNGIVSNTTSGNSNTIIAQTGGGASYASLACLITGLSQINVIANNSGSTQVGVPSSSVGIGSPSALPFVIAVNSVARLTMGSTATVATAYNFAGSLLANTATAGTNGALPSQVNGYWNIQLNGSSIKIPYYGV